MSTILKDRWKIIARPWIAYSNTIVIEHTIWPFNTFRILIGSLPCVIFTLYQLQIIFYQLQWYVQNIRMMHNANAMAAFNVCVF